MRARLSVVPVWAWIVLGAVVVGAALAIVIPAALQHDREQRFLDALDADVSTTVGGLPDEQLIVSLKVNCDQISNGWTIEKATAAGRNNWPAVAGASKVTEGEYIANVRALFTAAESVC